MDVDIMNQEESKLKPLSTELDSSLTTSITTGRDQSSFATLRHRHPPFDQSTFPPLRSMEPSVARAPPPAPSYMSMGKESVVSPSDISPGPSTSPQVMYHQPMGPPLYPLQEDDAGYDDDPDADPGMDVDELGSTKPQLESRGQPVNGDTGKGLSQKNFVWKLYQMMEDPEAKPYIQWGTEGREFIVTNQEEFAPKILSKHFKHSNFSSFVRQLNMYDFHKTNRAPRSQRGTAQHQLWIFSHPRFQKNRPDLLHGIKRKANEGGPLPVPGEDQLQAERRTSFVAGIRSPPSGLTITSEATIHGLQQENAVLKSKVQWLEEAYTRLEAKLNTLIQYVQPKGQQQPPLDARESSRPSIMANSRSMQHHTQDEQFDYGVPSTLGPVGAFQQQHGEGLQSPSVDSQSPVNQYHSPESRTTFASAPSVPPPSRQSSSATSVHSPTVGLSNSLTAAMTGGSSSYQSVQHQSNTVSLQSYDFLGIGGFNPLDPGAQHAAGQSGQVFSPTIAPTIASSQSRGLPLGSRGYTVTRTPAKAGPLAAVPQKVPPPNSSGGLFH